jgi:hypothetical protein
MADHFHLGDFEIIRGGDHDEIGLERTEGGDLLESALRGRKKTSQAEKLFPP